MDRGKKLNELIELFQAIVAKYSRFDEMAVRFSDFGRPLFKSELHFIKCVKEHSEANLSRLAALLGITRGAVSQVLVKLEKKKMVERTSRNRKEFSVSLTPTGEKVYQEHEEFHRNHFRELEWAMKLLPVNRINFIEYVFRTINTFYDTFEKRLAREASRKVKTPGRA
jgi:DNA-binding MarR family transcriptional regulator